jgi:hypothetical protein
MPRFTELYNDGGTAKWLSNKLNNGEFDYWLVVELLDMEEHVGEREAREMGGKYHISISVVSPSEAGNKNLNAAAESWGAEVKVKDMTAETKVEMLSDYGVKATVWQKAGSNAKKLLKAARDEAVKVEGLFGFYMDRPLNRIGNTGWDFIRGDIGWR